MKKKIRIFIYPIILMEFALILTTSCQKDETTSKKDTAITWTNPADINYGTLLSVKQLNAIADVPGTFVYSPTFGSKLNEGANQDLKVDFTPTDAVKYDTATKTVTINVIAANAFIDSRDGNLYHTVSIGTQVWMVENLRYLPSVVGSEKGSITTPYYYVYGYNGINVSDAKATSKYSTYGVLYNWSAAMNGAASSTANPSGVQGICPKGWHLPSDAEWTQLTDILGGESLAGGKLKETGFIHWYEPNEGATNQTGFTALPGGYCQNNYDPFYPIGFSGYWWSATEQDTSTAFYRALRCTSSYAYRASGDKKVGFSVRCVKD